jgi:hypothetical protein
MLEWELKTRGQRASVLRELLNFVNVALYMNDTKETYFSLALVLLSHEAVRMLVVSFSQPTTANITHLVIFPITTRIPS